jgi:hypothetical protein
VKEKLFVDFVIPSKLFIAALEEEVVWRKLHGDRPDEEENWFCAGIKLVNVDESSQNLTARCTKKSGIL